MCGARLGRASFSLFLVSQDESCHLLGTYELEGIVAGAINVGIFSSSKLLRGGLNYFHFNE